MVGTASSRHMACIGVVAFAHKLEARMTRHKSSERPPDGRHFRITLDGREFEGTYTVNGPILAVESLLLGIKRRQLGDAHPESLARLLLAELVYEHEAPRHA